MAGDYGSMPSDLCTPGDGSNEHSSDVKHDTWVWQGFIPAQIYTQLLCDNIKWTSGLRDHTPWLRKACPEFSPCTHARDPVHAGAARWWRAWRHRSCGSCLRHTLRCARRHAARAPCNAMRILAAKLRGPGFAHICMGPAWSRMPGKTECAHPRAVPTGMGNPLSLTTL